MERGKAHSPAASTASANTQARDEAVAARLLDSNVELPQKYKIVCDLRDTVEHYSKEAHVSFVRHVLPAIMTLLKTGTIVFITSSLDYRFRLAMLTTVLRLSSSEALRPQVMEMVNLCLRLMREDAEANAVLAVKILVDLFRTHKEFLQPRAPEVIEAILDVYASMPSVVRELFDQAPNPSPQQVQQQQQNSTGEIPTPPSSSGQSQNLQQTVPPGSRSFHILWEVPIAVVFLFQSYKNLVESHAKHCIPRCFEFLELHPQAQDAAHEAAAARGEVQLGPCPALEHKRTLFAEYVSAQVKTVSFIAYVLRSGAMNELTPQQRAAMPRIILRLFKDLPSESSNYRKDMFIAARHLISTELRLEFLPYVSEFMNDNILLGPSVTAHQSLRALALTVCADVVHHLRAELDLSQLSLVTHNMCCHVHDLALPYHHQTMCCRVLTGLIANLAAKHQALSTVEEREIAIGLFQVILETLLRKVEGLSVIRSDWTNWLRKRPSPDAKQSQQQQSKPLDDVDLERKKVADGVYGMMDPQNEAPLKDARVLLRACCVGAKAAMHQIKQLGARYPDAAQMARFFAAGIRCMSMFDFSSRLTDAGRTEIKETFEAFSDLFTQMDVLSFSAMWELTVLYRADHPKKLLQDAKANQEKEKEEADKNPQNGSSTPAVASAQTPARGASTSATTATEGAEETSTPAEAGPSNQEGSAEASATSIEPAEKPAKLLEIFIEEAIYTSPELAVIPQTLLSNQQFSQCFVGILLRHLVTLLPELGTRGQAFSQVVIRLFKLSFMAVSLYSDVNESVLLPHVHEIMMQGLKLASHTKQPQGYYMLLRNLFRSIGGGRFEQIFKAILPLLSPMLEQLQTLVSNTEPPHRDLFVELSLTVPVRLSVLLPFLGYLMKPLRLALDAGPELLAQGLRTLELCVDNLTHEFLNPFLQPHLDDVLVSLWRLLKPSSMVVPTFSQQALRILGKLGGRSRSLINRPKLKWTHATPASAATLPIQFDGKFDRNVPLRPLVELAVNTLPRGDLHFRTNAFAFLKSTAATFVRNKLPQGECEEVFGLLIRGLFVCARLPECRQEASTFLVDYLSFIMMTELTKEGSEGAGMSRQYLPLTSAILDALSEALASTQDKALESTGEQLAAVITRVVFKSDLPQERTMPAFRQLASRLSSLCYEQCRKRKMGGVAGLQIMVSKLSDPQVGNAWLQNHELELIRSLLFMIKDTGPEVAPSEVKQVMDFFTVVLRQSSLLLNNESPEFKSRLNYLIGLLMIELSSQSASAREAAQIAMTILAERLKTSVSELLAPLKPRLLLPIFNRPLRALAFHMQIGHIDALTYLLTLDPPLVEFGDLPARAPSADSSGQPSLSAQGQETAEANGHLQPNSDAAGGSNNSGAQSPAVSPGQAQAHPRAPGSSASSANSLQSQQSAMTPYAMTRLLVEVIGIADAEDHALITKPNPLKSADLLAQLRIVCVRFLSAALGTPEVGSPRHAPTRSRILAVNFRLLYNPRTEVVDAAYTCLKNVKSLQSKLPKDMLQAGLRPILTHLADARKLDVSCLEGLARLLELLNNYFKVEIGTKLLEHFKTLSSDRAALERAAINPSSQHAELQVLAGIVNIFRLLPYPAAGAFLPELSRVVVLVENALHRCGATIFTEPLAKYLDRYPSEASDFFFHRMAEDSSYARTFLAVLGSEHAPHLREHLIATATQRMSPFFGAAPPPAQEHEEKRPPWRGPRHTAQVLLLLCRDDPTWIEEQTALIGALVSRWVSPARKTALDSRSSAVIEQLAEDDAVLEVFYHIAPIAHVDVLFHAIEYLSAPRPADTAKLRRFIYRMVMKANTAEFKRIALERFFSIFDMPTFPKALHELGLRHVINPMLTVAFNRNPPEELVTPDTLKHLAEKVWAFQSPQIQQQKFSPGLRIELMAMTSLLARNGRIHPDLRRSAVNFALASGSDHDALVQQTSNGLLVTFTAATFSADTPFKIILKLYGQLLRAHGVESRHLARSSLDQLTTVFTSIGDELKNASANNLPAERIQMLQQMQQAWYKATRVLMTEEGLAQLTQLVHILHFIVRNSELFYVRREQFLPFIVTTLPRLSTSAASTVETRVLALELYALLLKWEQKRVALASKDDDAMDVDNEDDCSSANQQPKSAQVGGGSSASAGNSQWQVPPNLRDNIVANLMKMITYMSDPSQRSQALVPKAITLLRGFLAPDVFKDANIRMGTFALLRADITPQNIHAFISTAEILCLVVEQETDEWVAHHLPILQQLLEKGMSSNLDAAHQALAPVLLRIFHLLRDVPTPTPASTSSADAPNGRGESAAVADVPAPEQGEDRATFPGKPEVAKAFLIWATEYVEKTINGPTGTLGTIALLVAMSKSRPSRIDPFLTQIQRLYNLTCKAYLSGQPLTDLSENARNKIIEGTMHLLSLRYNQLGSDERPWLTTYAAQLAGGAQSIPLCRFLLGLVSGWIFETDPAAAPSAQEKANVLLKMCAFEHRNDPLLLYDFLHLILKIYQDPAFQRSELTLKLENAFLLGCRCRDPTLRTAFLEIFDGAVSRSLFTRLHYILGVQNWEALAEYWLHQAVDLLLGAANPDLVLYEPSDGTLSDERFRPFATELSSLRSGELIRASRRLLYADPTLTQDMWIATFKAAWSCLTDGERAEVLDFSIDLLSKEYHLRAVDRMPNPVQGVLSGLQACSPTPVLPPHLVRYLARTFNAWWPAVEMLQDNLETLHDESAAIQDSRLDALAELYADLGEDDHYYGLWRRRAFYPETNIALSFEQAGLWQQAQLMYESAQSKARAGTLPFSQSEYNVWEDHWVLCGSKLQQWEVLGDLAKFEDNADLSLDAMWRTKDWQKDREQIDKVLQTVVSSATARRRFFDSFLGLLKSNEPAEKERLITGIGATMDLCLRKWYHLPASVGPAHYPLLHTFQLVIELQEAAQVFNALSQTTAANLDQRSQELKSILVTWRERLPNEWDDINIWSDLVSWRQHVFSSVNDTYLPLLPQTQGAPAPNAPSYAYRGYHETAWITNRFAHTARKHQLMDVCVNSLNKIYTLPNIEIQEAFLKLREQAKCCFHNPAELSSGLEVINNTNLQFFSNHQKAEFFTLKAMFFAKLERNEDAAQTFSAAITLDHTFAKAWAQYGEYHDNLFKKNPTNLQHASDAVASYLQAAGLYKNAKVRRLLVRILWLLSLDDAQGTIAKSFETFKGDVPTWYWVSFIPQLLLSLSHREAKYARIILMKIARAYPQALFFQLRTSKEETSVIRKQYLATRAAAEKARAASTAGSGHGENSSQHGSGAAQDGDVEMGGTTQAPQQVPTPQQSQQPGAPKHPWDFVEEITAVLKTAFPMLALTLETMGDQIVQRFKPAADEDNYRILVAFCNDAVQQYVTRGCDSNDDCEIAPQTVSNISRLMESTSLNPLLKADYEKHFKGKQITLKQYIVLLQRWRDLYEGLVDLKARRLSLESSSHWLVDFPYHKLDEVEVPGQYFKNQDNAQGFARIAYFQNRYDLVRTSLSTVRRITMVGHDGSHHSFAVQVPSPRTARREERIGQFFRLLNGVLIKNKDTRRRRIDFNIPVMMPISSHVRLVQNDASMVTLQDIYEQHCQAAGIEREYPTLHFIDKVRAMHKAKGGLNAAEMEAARLEAFDEVALKYLPDDLLKHFMTRTMSTATDLWLARKQTTLDWGAFTFMSYILFMSLRSPAKIHLTRSNGRVHMSETLATLDAKEPEFINTDPVPFRFTPAIQKLVTAIGTEGVMTNAIFAIAQALLERENELEHMLSIFVREEVISWHHQYQKPPAEGGPKHWTLRNIKSIVQRTRLLSCASVTEQPRLGTLPANQTILQLVAQATNTGNLAQMDPTLLPWL